jgi:hypothetical protein
LQRPDPQAVPRKAFLDMVKSIADIGLEDPGQIARLMHTRFVVKRTNINVARCPNWRSAQTDDYTPEGGVWYLSQPDRAKGAVQEWPGAGGPLGNPEIAYHITATTLCAGRHATKPEISASMQFNRVGGFPCVNPNAHRPTSTWIADPTRSVPGAYSGKVSEENGVSVKFSILLSDECFVQISIVQQERDGNKYRRASDKLNACISKRPYAERDACGTLDAYIEKE